MAAEIKFCGLTRAEDAAVAAELGAAYAGVIFAGGPRLLTVERAAAVFAAIPAGVAKVGVFGAQPPDVIAAAGDALGLDVVQLHADPDAASVAAVRRRFAGRVWAVVRVEDDRLPSGFDAVGAAADAVVLDAKVAGLLGGSGRSFDWDAVARRLGTSRRPRRLVLAGGLTPENVARAVAAVAPDVVDVSSGVETSPGVKDHARMRAFVGALVAPSVVMREER